MSEFRGYLIGNSNGETLDRYIQYDTYKAVPNQREELVAYRDDNTRELYRETADGMKTTISFNTLPVDLKGKMAIQNFFNNAMVIAKERKVRITYWDDDENTYKSSYFYLPSQLEFNIRTHTDDNIFYKPLSIELIEY
jgi:hypothetical protein